MKKSFEHLRQGGSVRVEIDEQIVYGQLNDNEQAICSLLLASGYLKVKDFQSYTTEFRNWKQEYELALTNFEVRVMFFFMVRKWFSGVASSYNDFIKALLLDDVKAMNTYMNRVALQTFSYFDTGKSPSEEEPELFYHDFVLGLMVELADEYVVTSNRESGFGRYDVRLESRNPCGKTSESGNGKAGVMAGKENASRQRKAIIIEFKVQEDDEKELGDTVQARHCGR